MFAASFARYFILKNKINMHLIVLANILRL